ncbi:MAG: DUF3046 domain-containing protein [Salinibacterium sp.]|nr:MAG: DUF3046 domain-containing protein [Salinibacterium sp.]
MRLSEFWLAVSDEFGADYGRVLTHDLVLGAVGGFTAEQAVAKGIPVREIWLALCEATDVPAERRYGVGQREPKKS